MTADKEYEVWRYSGGGATVEGEYDTEDEALAAADYWADDDTKVEVTRRVSENAFEVVWSSDE